jgi:hypothetical protein
LTLRLNGSTSGYTELDAPAVAGSNTITLPTGAGSANQLLKNGATAGSLAFGTATEDASGNLAFNSGYGSSAVAYGCRAWVNFNGTGTVAIRASGNVSSITDHAVGQYTINFTTALVDASYALVVGGGNGRVAGSGVVFGGIAQAAPTASAARISVFQQSPTAFDPEDCHVAIFR